MTSDFKIPGVIWGWLRLSQKQNYRHTEYIPNPNDDCLFPGFKKSLKIQKAYAFFQNPLVLSALGFMLVSYKAFSALDSQISPWTHFFTGQVDYNDVDDSSNEKFTKMHPPAAKYMTFHLTFIFRRRLVNKLLLNHTLIVCIEQQQQQKLSHSWEK